MSNLASIATAAACLTVAGLSTTCDGPDLKDASHRLPLVQNNVGLGFEREATGNLLSALDSGPEQRSGLLNKLSEISNTHGKPAPHGMIVDLLLDVAFNGGDPRDTNKSLRILSSCCQENIAMRDHIEKRLSDPEFLVKARELFSSDNGRGLSDLHIGASPKYFLEMCADLRISHPAIQGIISDLMDPKNNFNITSGNASGLSILISIKNLETIDTFTSAILAQKEALLKYVQAGTQITVHEGSSPSDRTHALETYRNAVNALELLVGLGDSSPVLTSSAKVLSDQYLPGGVYDKVAKGLNERAVLGEHPADLMSRITITSDWLSREQDRRNAVDPRKE